VQASPEIRARDALRPLKLMTVANIVLLSVQAWTGDVVNLFSSFPSGTVNGVGGAVQELQSAGPGPLAIYHGVQGVVILILAIGISALAFGTKSRGVRIASLLALASVVAAAIGGYYFVFSGFTSDGNSAQMGGSFIGAYAMNFLVLYYSK